MQIKSTRKIASSNKEKHQTMVITLHWLKPNIFNDGTLDKGKHTCLRTRPEFYDFKNTRNNWIPFSTANYDGRWESQLEIFFLTEYNILARRVTRFARRILSQRILPPRPSLFLPSLARRKCNCNLHARRFNDSAGYTRELQFSSPTVFVPVEMTAVSVITDFLTS